MPALMIFPLLFALLFDPTLATPITTVSVKLLTTQSFRSPCGDEIGQEEYHRRFTIDVRDMSGLTSVGDVVNEADYCETNHATCTHTYNFAYYFAGRFGSSFNLKLTISGYEDDVFASLRDCSESKTCTIQGLTRNSIGTIHNCKTDGGAHQISVQISAVTECAVPLNSQFPENAVSCGEYVCNSQFYKTSSGCTACSPCAAGQVRVNCGGLLAGNCVACALPNANSFFLTTGLTSNNCNNYMTCPSNNYYLENLCVQCSACGAGQFRVNCFGYSSGQCQACPVAPPNSVYRTTSLTSDNCANFECLAGYQLSGNLCVVASQSASSSASRTSTVTPSPSQTASSTPRPSNSPSRTPFPSSSQTVSATPSMSESRTISPTASGSVSQTSTTSASNSQTTSSTQSSSNSLSQSATLSSTNSPTQTLTLSSSQTVSATPSMSESRTISGSASSSPSTSRSSTTSQSASNSQTASSTQSSSNSLSQSATLSSTHSMSRTPSLSSSASRTSTVTQSTSTSNSLSQSATLSSTNSLSQTSSSSQSFTPTNSNSQSTTISPSVSVDPRTSQLPKSKFTATTVAMMAGAPVLGTLALLCCCLRRRRVGVFAVPVAPVKLQSIGAAQQPTRARVVVGPNPRIDDL